MIGGEFQISVIDMVNTDGKCSASSNLHMYSSGRAALFQILKYLKKEKALNRVLLPDYLCSSVLVPVKLLDLKYEFYHIDEKLELILDEFKKLYKSGTAVLLINYFGLKDLKSQINDVRSIDTDAIIIEDDVQAYYEFLKPLDSVDFKFTSLRKTFAIPDGGLVKTNYHLPNVSTPNTFGQYKAAAALLKSMREGNFNDKIYLELFKKGEELIDVEIECGMSHIADKLYSFVNDERAKVQRIINAQYLIGQLDKIGISPILPIEKGHVPLFIPVALKNRDKVRKAMFKKEIFCPVHWPLSEEGLKRGKALAETELSIIIDQRYSVRDMDEIINVLKENII